MTHRTGEMQGRFSEIWPGGVPIGEQVSGGPTRTLPPDPPFGGCLSTRRRNTIHGNSTDEGGPYEKSGGVGVGVGRRRDGVARRVGFLLLRRRDGAGERGGDERLGRVAARKGDLRGVGRLLAQPTGKDITIIGSGALVRSLLEEGLLDELRLMVHPVVLGSGKRLFVDGGERRPLELSGSKAFGTGVLDLTYRPAGNEQEE